MSSFDTTDHALLRQLSRDADQSAAALAQHLGMSQPAIWRRLRRLEQSGILNGQRLVLDREKLGFGVTVFLGVKLGQRRCSA